jgi:hypothetical protein
VKLRVVRDGTQPAAEPMGEGLARLTAAARQRHSAEARSLKETAAWSEDPDDAAAATAMELQRPDEAEAEHSAAPQEGAVVEAGRQASGAQALTQRISRRWFEESHNRRDPDAIEFRPDGQDAR